jgi:hypothetical protein
MSFWQKAPNEDKLTRDLLVQLDVWVGVLAAPFLPPLSTLEPGGTTRLEFRHHSPHAVMIAKLVRAVSAIRAAHALADLGYVTESAALMRMVSAFCGEVMAVGELLSHPKVSRSVGEFVDQFFTPKPTSLEEHDANETRRCVSREELMKAQVRLANHVGMDGERLRRERRQLEAGLDAYVNGSQESAMDLYDPRGTKFLMAGHPSPDVRSRCLTAVAGRLRDVIAAIEVTAAVVGNGDILGQAEQARRGLDEITGRFRIPV